MELEVYVPSRIEGYIVFSEEPLVKSLLSFWLYCAICITGRTWRQQKNKTMQSEQIVGRVLETTSSELSEMVGKPGILQEVSTIFLLISLGSAQKVSPQGPPVLGAFFL